MAAEKKPVQKAVMLTVKTTLSNTELKAAIKRVLNGEEMQVKQVSVDKDQP